MHYALFETAIGTCGIVWGEQRARRASICPTPIRRARARAWSGAFPARCPPSRRPLCNRPSTASWRCCAARSATCASIELDIDGVPAFNRRVYELARTIPPGATMTYGDIARRLGQPGHRARGRAGARSQSVAHRRALPSRARGRRPHGRLLGAGRRGHQAPDARNRRRRGRAGRTDAVLSLTLVRGCGSLDPPLTSRSARAARPRARLRCDWPRRACRGSRRRET